MYAALIRASESWRGIQIKPFEAKQLQAVGDELDQEFRDRHSLTKSEGASPSKQSTRNRT